MRKPSVKCALITAMIAEHHWGSPIVEENLLAIAAIEPSDYPTATMSSTTYALSPTSRTKESRASSSTTASSVKERAATAATA